MAKLTYAANLLCAAAFLLTLAACDKNTPSEETSQAKGDFRSVAEITDEAKHFNGLFDLYQDEENGSLYLKILPNQLGKDIIHHMQVSNGIRGSNIYKILGLGFESHVLRFEQYFDKIYVRQENNSFVHDMGTPASRADLANDSRFLLAALKIEAKDKNSGALFVNVDSLFLNDSLRQLKPSPDPEEKSGGRLTLGKLNEEKTRFTSLHNYPKATDIVVEYVYDNPPPVLLQKFGSEIKDYALGDEHSLAFSIRHIFTQAQEKNFVPRRENPPYGLLHRSATDDEF